MRLPRTLGPPTVLGPHGALGPHRVLGLHRVLGPHKVLGPLRVLGPVLPVCHHELVSDNDIEKTYIFRSSRSQIFFDIGALKILQYSESKRDSNTSVFL